MVLTIKCRLIVVAHYIGQVIPNIVIICLILTTFVFLFQVVVFGSIM